MSDVDFSADQVEMMRSEITDDEFLRFMQRNPGTYRIRSSAIGDLRIGLASLTTNPNLFLKELVDSLARLGDSLDDVVVVIRRGMSEVGWEMSEREK